MKRYTILLPFIALLFAASCKETEPIITDMVELEEARPVYLPDSVSFKVDGKTYTTDNKGAISSLGFGNSGINYRLSDTLAEWYSTAGNRYWIGAADSVQYTSMYKKQLDGGNIGFTYIKNYRKSDTMKDWMYLPKKDIGFYHLGKYNYALDFQRNNQQEGVAIEVRIDNVIFSGTSYTTKTLNQESTFSKIAQDDANFEILKIVDLKGTDFVRIEGKFEVNIFDSSEKKVLRITDGYFRSNVLKYGNRDSFLNK